jgi:Holliday junction resolvasome RuvABC endonuclease subunit
VKSIGLDLSLKSTGVCIVSQGLEPPLEIRTIRIVNDLSKDTKGRILDLIDIAKAISDLVDRERPDVVVIEAPAMNQQWQAAAIGELHGVVKHTLWAVLSIVPVVEQATKMRSMVVGKIGRSFEKVLDDRGKVKKRVSYGTIEGKHGKQKRATVKDVIEIRLRERGLVFPSQDEMDAYVAAKFGLDLLAAKD